jgi:hypothetical protein
VDLMHDARRWTDIGRDYLPMIGCSKCGKGCLPLCGLGMNRRISPMETKDVVLKSRKTMLETGKRVPPMQIQLVTSADVVISCETALDCIEEREIPGHGRQWVFVRPIPTISGLVCKECQACTLCGATASNEEVRHHQGKRIKVCTSCSDVCSMCNQSKVRHHACCVGLSSRFLSGKGRPESK